MLTNLKLLVFSSLLLLTGCVTGTRDIALEIPAQSAGKTNVGEVYIIGINDLRTFEQKPASPRTPSVKGKLDSSSVTERSRLIGRQRNGYGAAMGSVALPEGGTVQEEMKKLIGASLQNHGYALSDSPDTAKKLEVDINKFWAWFVPGFMSVGFESELEANLSLKDGTSTTQATVAGAGSNRGQIASDANWQLTYKRAYEDFLKNLDSALEEIGL